MENLFNEMDQLWEGFKSATWQMVTVEPATIKPITTRKDN